MTKRMRRKRAAAGWCRPVRMQGTGKTCSWKGRNRCGRMRLRRRTTEPEKRKRMLRRRRHRNFRTISASTASRTASRSTPRMRRGSIRYPIRQWCARPDFTTQRRAELTRFPPSICGGNSMAVCMGSTRRGFTGESCSILCPITSAQRIHSVRTSITSWDSRRRWAA